MALVLGQRKTYSLTAPGPNCCQRRRLMKMNASRDGQRYQQFDNLNSHPAHDPIREKVCTKRRPLPCHIAGSQGRPCSGAPRQAPTRSQDHQKIKTLEIAGFKGE